MLEFWMVKIVLPVIYFFFDKSDLKKMLNKMSKIIIGKTFRKILFFSILKNLRRESKLATKKIKNLLQFLFFDFVH